MDKNEIIKYIKEYHYRTFKLFSEHIDSINRKKELERELENIEIENRNKKHKHDDEYIIRLYNKDKIDYEEKTFENFVEFINEFYIDN